MTSEYESDMEVIQSGSRSRVEARRTELLPGFARHFVEDVHRPFRVGFRKVQASRDVKAFLVWVDNLHHHHAIEDRMVFPGMKQRHPELVEHLDRLEKDHQLLIDLEQDIRNGQCDKIDEFVEHLMEHLNREEMLLVPIALSEGSVMGQ